MVWYERRFRIDPHRTYHQDASCNTVPPKDNSQQKQQQRPKKQPTGTMPTLQSIAPNYAAETLDRPDTKQRPGSNAPLCRNRTQASPHPAAPRSKTSRWATSCPSAPEVRLPQQGKSFEKMSCRVEEMRGRWTIADFRADRRTSITLTTCTAGN